MLLKKAKIINYVGSTIGLTDYKKVQNLMLKYSGNAFDRERNKILCRRYKCGEKHENLS